MASTRRDSPILIDTPQEALLALVFALILSLWVFGHHPLINAYISDYLASKMSSFSGDSVTFTQFQMDKITSDYSPYRAYELAYCGLLDGSRVADFFVSDIRAASATDVILSCPEKYNLLLHFHPSDSPAVLSDHDVWSLLSSESVDVSCVYSEGALNCWKRSVAVDDSDNGRGIERLTVKVE